MKLKLDVDIKLGDELTSEKLTDIFHTMIGFVENVTLLNNSKWFFSGDSLEDSMKKPAFENSKPSFILKNKENIEIIESIWAEGNSLTIQHAAISNQYILRFNIREVNSLSISNTLKSLHRILSIFNVICFKLDTNNYAYNQKQVFPDRLPVGWMLYLNKKITQQQVPMAAELIDIENKKNSGTLIISTDHVFDGSNKDDIKKANEIEIQLTALGLLPLYSEIYS
ncbi:Imm52 family immunity protein [Moellerella wisconsensis]|uniref:Imm52 family immunity protein n=1 Tax=Moellerella wisconsensis TaxID=158849 RepID=UPI0030761672